MVDQVADREQVGWVEDGRVLEVLEGDMLLAVRRVSISEKVYLL